LARRLDRRNRPAGRPPVFSTAHVTYEVSERTTATNAGGVAAAHVLAKKLGLVDEIDRTLQLLKVHLPYHESDHVMNIAYNIMAGGTKLEDLELLRQDESYMDSLGAARIPDPTTAGDFLRRFSAENVIALMDAVNRIRVALWKRQPREFRRLGIIDADGTVAPTDGEKKLGMALNHKGIWGYHPLLVSLANTKEPLFIVNRPGNCVSHDDAAMWIDRAVDLAREAFDEVLVRGDTDFSLTVNFDRWTDDGVNFVFGYDACKNLVGTADSLPNSAWRPLVRKTRAVKTRERETRENVKERIVREHGYENIRLRSERDARVRIPAGEVLARVPDDRRQEEPHARARRDRALPRDQVLLLRDERSEDDARRRGRPRERPLRPGEPDRAAEERRERLACPGVRPRVQLPRASAPDPSPAADAAGGVHGGCLSGMDSEGVDGARAAAHRRPRRSASHGVQAVPELRDEDTVPGRADGAAGAREDTRVHGPRAAPVRDRRGGRTPRSFRRHVTVTLGRRRGGSPVVPGGKRGR
jgi:hypothetical protein